MKKLSLLLTSLMLCLSLTACGSQGKTNDKKDTTPNTESSQTATGTSFSRTNTIDTNDNLEPRNSIVRTNDNSDNSNNSNTPIRTAVADGLDTVDAALDRTRYDLMVQNGKVHDTDGILTDGENHQTAKKTM